MKGRLGRKDHKVRPETTELKGHKETTVHKGPLEHKAPLDRRDQRGHKAQKGRLDRMELAGV